MIHGAHNHPKIKTLARILQKPLCLARGVCESIWHFTADFCPQGNIGKWSNEHIAAEMEWPDEADALIDALVLSGLLERHDVHRLVVHDWHQHSFDTTDRYLARKGMTYWNGANPRRKSTMHADDDDSVPPVARRGAPKTANRTSRRSESRQLPAVAIASSNSSSSLSGADAPQGEGVQVDPPGIGGNGHDPAADEYSDGFRQFRDAYPQHRWKNEFDAWGIWQEMGCEQLTPEIVASVARHCLTFMWRKDGGAAVPFPPRFLRSKLWLDKIADAELEGPGGPPGPSGNGKGAFEHVDLRSQRIGKAGSV